jgi:glycosyltransferase involved in cell wall biosynthesis
MKIAYCYHSLNHHGGIEKVLSIKANYLVQQLGYEVYIIIYNQQEKPVFFDFDERIKIIDLMLGEFAYDSNNFIKNQIAYQKYRKNFKTQLTNILSEIRPDYSISLGGGEFYILNSIKQDGSVKLAEYHVTIGAFEIINKDLKGIGKLRAKMSFKRFISNIKKYNKFIVLTNGDQKEWSGFSTNVISIPNPQTFKIESQNLPQQREKLAVAVGRFEPEKQFDKLILFWKEVVSKFSDWTLVLKGSGSEEVYYRRLIVENALEDNVIIEEPSTQMDDFYKRSSLYLMASKFEGFSLVMLEAMQSGLPIVAFNCKYGPSELINDKENGFLINTNDDEGFLKTIILLIEDENLRREMSLKAIENAKEYEIEKIMNIWKNIFEGQKNG